MRAAGAILRARYSVPSWDTFRLSFFAGDGSPADGGRDGRQNSQNAAVIRLQNRYDSGKTVE